jgi:hypothetical protein
MISIIISALTALVCLFTNGWPMFLPVMGLAFAINAILKNKFRPVAILCSVLNGFVVILLLWTNYHK